MLPKTPGLLVSMAMRADHSFGFDTSMFCSMDNLESKQIRLIEEANEQYDRIASGKTYVLNDLTTFKQVAEETTGRGFYQEKLEYAYREMPTLEALAKALELVKNGNQK